MQTSDHYYLLKSYTVLIVEDDKMALESLSTTLRRYFKSVITAIDGVEAYAKCLSLPIDLILTDMRMPNMDGIELAKKIRTIHPSLPIIFMSAFQDSTTLLKVIPLNITEYLIKPIEINRVLDLAITIIQRTNSNSSITKPLIYLRNGISIDLDTKIVQKNDELIMLTKKEFELLNYLIQNRRSILSKTEIEYALWDGEIISESSVKTLLKKLRLKIGEDSIITVKNLGYKIDILY